MTDKKTKVLEILLERCKDPKTGKWSAETFICEALRFATDKSIKDPSVEPSELESEKKNILEIAAKYKVEVVPVLGELQRYVSGQDADSGSWVALSSALRDLEFRTAAGCSVTAAMICEKIFASPSAVISSAISKYSNAKNSEPAQTDAPVSQDSEADFLIGLLQDGTIQPDSDPKAEYPVPEEPEPNPADIPAILKETEKVRKALFNAVYGQDHAVSSFVTGFFQSELSAAVLDKRDKPRASFLFAGPPGVGKTFLAEQAAAALGLPFMRFDMSEYSEKESNLEFAGSDKVYKNGAEGNVTGFVSKNPRCVLLFDEIEKAHLNIIYLFLQLLDAGVLRDNFTDEEVSFKDAIVIFTTNVGKRMYDDDTVNLLTVSKKSVLKALSTEINPVTGAPAFPAAICSRFSAGNVVMFNRLDAGYLIKISEREINKNISAISQKTGLKIDCDPVVPCAILFSQGGRADARTVKGKSASFVYGELYELFRLLQSERSSLPPEKLKSVKFKLDFSGCGEAEELFKKPGKPGILVFAEKKEAASLGKIRSADVYAADSLAMAKKIAAEEDISLVLCDVKCGLSGDIDVLNIEDANCAGIEFFKYATEFMRKPLYVFTDPANLTDEEAESLTARGARGVISPKEDAKVLGERLCELANHEYLRYNLIKLARANKVLSFGTSQKLAGNGAEITLYGFTLKSAVDAEDNNGVLSDIDRPDIKFDDVIGAKDAKEELAYFVKYLKNPGEYARKGLKMPKGVILFGPPGTGKTMLAKAMAGESDVTFIHTEGNKFLKKFVGEGTAAVHDLFAAARKYAPSILFIDEIDAIGKERGQGAEESHTDDVLTALLAEMDGFKTDGDRPVFVLAATNYGADPDSPRRLDPALLRRFDRRIYMDLPDKDERMKFIRLKVGKIKNHSLTEGQLENIAVRSTGSSLAELDSVFELALRNTIKSDEATLTDEILEDAFETYNGGEIKKWSDTELLRTARHEAGHAVMCWAGGEKPSYLTIVARGSHGGYMQHGDAEKKGIYTKNELLARVRTCLGGRAAEMAYYGDEDGLSSGASGDLNTATAIVRSMICDYGMDEKTGLCSINSGELKNSQYFGNILARVNEVLSAELERAKKVINANRGAIDSLTDRLLEKNSLKLEEIAEILEKNFVKAD